jgi:hypothetical protein
MKTISQHLEQLRSNTRGDEEVFRRILSQIPEQQPKRRLISPYVAYFLTTCVSMYALFFIAVPSYNDYVVYRNDFDVEVMRFDEEVDAWNSTMLEQDIQQYERYQ